MKLEHAHSIAMLAAVEFGVPVAEYTPAEIKRAVVGYGRAEKPQVQQMVKLLLGLDRVPSPHDAADALAVGIRPVHQAGASPARARLGGRAPPPGARGAPGSPPATTDTTIAQTARMRAERSTDI